MYKNFFKRLIDFCLAFFGLIVLSPVFFVLIIVGTINMKGNPFFVQSRPGKDNKVFNLIKFRTMTQEKDKEGNYLPDDQRLTKYGKLLRSTSLDELPELFNILIGQMAIIGPRPQLIKDLAFMNEEQRHRHDVRPGLTGLAQINGRNNITWEEKFNFDLEYINNLSFVNDIKIFFATVFKVLKRSDVNREGTASDIDYGDWLLEQGIITQEEYNKTIEAYKKEYENKTDKPWGYEKVLIYTEKYLTKELYIREGFQTSFHYHDEKDETMYILSGSGYIEFEDHKEYFSKNDSIISSSP